MDNSKKMSEVLQRPIQGFPEGVPTPGGANLLFSIIFAENCMEMKKNDGGGGHVLVSPKSTTKYTGRECLIRTQLIRSST